MDYNKIFFVKQHFIYNSPLTGLFSTRVNDMMEISDSVSVLVLDSCLTDICQRLPSTCNKVIVIRAFINSQLGPSVLLGQNSPKWFQAISV